MHILGAQSITIRSRYLQSQLNGLSPTQGFSFSPLLCTHFSSCAVLFCPCSPPKLQVDIVSESGPLSQAIRYAQAQFSLLLTRQSW